MDDKQIPIKIRNLLDYIQRYQKVTLLIQNVVLFGTILSHHNADTTRIWV